MFIAPSLLATSNSMKRAGDFGGMPEAKMQMMVAPGQQGETWTCKDCQNVNWPLRTICNQKNCGSPGPWTCPACSNKNFQGRMVCNRKGCGLPRQDLGGGYSPMGGMMSGMKGGMGKGMAAMGWMPAMGGMMSMQGPGGVAPDGSWVCKQCQNLNYPRRTTCNKKECGAPGPWSCPTCDNKNFQGRDVCNRKNCGQPRPEESVLQALGGGNSQNQGAPDGSWACPACANINWPMRTTCNKKTCGQPRP